MQSCKFLTFSYQDTNLATFSTTELCLDEGVFVGANSTIFQYLNIENWSVVGAGSIVLKKIKKNTLNIGSPTKTIKKINKNYKVFKTNL